MAKFVQFYIRFLTIARRSMFLVRLGFFHSFVAFIIIKGFLLAVCRSCILWRLQG